MNSAFVLHPRLEQDTTHVTDLALCTIRLMNDSRFPWLILVPMRGDVREIHELAATDRHVLIEEMSGTARALERVTGADKINIGALGNMVPQLHIHVVARFQGDAAWPGPVWGTGPSLLYSHAARASLIEKLRGAIFRT